MTIPAPPVLHFRLPKDGIKKNVYPDLDQFFHDLATAYQQAIKAFYQAGCRYLQFDDTVWAYLCSQEELRKARERMSNVDQLQGIYARVINTALKPSPPHYNHHPRLPAISVRPGFPRAVTSRWRETLLGKCRTTTATFSNTTRSGPADFEPLRFLPKGNKLVGLGLVTSKSGTLERKDDVKPAHR